MAVAVKLVPRGQVALEQDHKNAPGPVNALGFQRPRIPKKEESESSDFRESKLRASRSPRHTGRHGVAGSLSPDPEELPRRGSNRRYQPGVVGGVHVPRTPRPSRPSGPSGPSHYERRTQTRRAPQVSQRVRQLQAQHESELAIQFKKKRVRKLEKKKKKEHEEAKKSSKSIESLGSEMKAQAFQEPAGQAGLPDPALRVQSDPITSENQADKPAKPATSGAGQPPEVDLADPAVSEEQLIQPCSFLPKAPSQHETRQDAKQGTDIVPRAVPVPALALKRWRQARKRQHLLRQMKAMSGEMKFERRQLVSALQRPFNFSGLEAELQKHARDLKARFQSLYLKISSDRKEQRKRLQVLKVLEAEHLELQRAFVKLMNQCGFARPSALRAPGDHKIVREADDEEEDDDVIVEGIEETEQIPEPDSKSDELKKELQREALRAELLLRALDAGKSL